MTTTKVECQWNYEWTHDVPYLTIMGELVGVSGKEWPQNNK